MVAPHSDDNVATASGRASECLRSSAPDAAPANMSRTDAIRLCHRGLVPPANEESAARPVMVRVRTVVVRSGSAIFLTVAFLTPMAMAVRTIRAYTRLESEEDER